jgi:hypothetical protein
MPLSRLKSRPCRRCVSTEEDGRSPSPRPARRSTQAPALARIAACRPATALAGPADVVAQRPPATRAGVRRLGDDRHDDTGWEHYADGGGSRPRERCWRRGRFAIRTSRRSRRGVSSGLHEARVRARDSYGYGGRETASPCHMPTPKRADRRLKTPAESARATPDQLPDRASCSGPPIVGAGVASGLLIATSARIMNPAYDTLAGGPCRSSSSVSWSWPARRGDEREAYKPPSARTGGGFVVWRPAPTARQRDEKKWSP